MNKRWLGIPVPIVSVLLAMVLVTGAALATMFMFLEQPATVSIIGAEVTAWANEACNEEMPETLDFGNIDAGTTSDPVSIWLLNEGDYPAYMALSTTGLDSLLELTETNLGVVPADPSELELMTTIPVADWVETATTTTLTAAITNSALSMYFADQMGYGVGETIVVKIDDELIQGAFVASPPLYFQGSVVRGFADTTATSHLAGATVTLMEWTLIEAVYSLEVGEKLEVTLTLTADSYITRDNYPFTLNIKGYDDPNFTP